AGCPGGWDSRRRVEDQSKIHRYTASEHICLVGIKPTRVALVGRVKLVVADVGALKNVLEINSELVGVVGDAPGLRQKRIGAFVDTREGWAFIYGTKIAETKAHPR